jgi:hypothetical protein
VKKWLTVFAVLLAMPLIDGGRVWGQVDPEQRQLLQFGYDQPLVGHSPISGYAYYFLNAPNYPGTNRTLRLSVAPIYLDGELAFQHLISENTDFAIGLAGGGFADSYFEFKQGTWTKSESFTGHGGNVTASIYQLFNPTQKIPLYGIFRVSPHYSLYDRDSDTAANFVLPRDHTSIDVRTGLRFGGEEPTMSPDVAMELSVWYEGQFRAPASPYGFSGDREVEEFSHLFWARGLFAYTLPKLRHNFGISLTGGASINPDRFSAYRLGGHLPLVSEFPLMLPGYYYQELSARNFGLLSTYYTVPISPNGRWRLTAFASGGRVTYLDGLEQPGHWNSGVGGGIGYRSPKGTVHIVAGYSYGFQAIRDHDRGGQTIGILCQIDLEARLKTHEPEFDIQNPYKSRGLYRFLGR